MDKTLKIAVILSAYDKMSAVIDKSVNGSIKKLTKLQQSADNIAKKSFAMGRDAGAVGAGLAAPLVYATKKAIDFEDKMADVGKAFNFKVGSADFDKFGRQAKDLGVYMGKSAEEGAALMAALGQGGVAKSDLQKVAKNVAQIGVAFDLTADIAGDRYTKLKNALNSSWSETKKVTDAINYLSDNQASKASEILDFMSAGGAAVARASKSAGQELASMGSYLISIGKSGAESATIMQRFYKGIMKNDGTRSMFDKAGGGVAGMMAVLQKGANMKDANEQFKFFQNFGEYGSDIRLMAQNMDGLKASINSVSKASNYASSVQNEFNNRNSTTKFKAAQEWERFNNVLIEFGANGLPIINDFLISLRKTIQRVSIFIQNNRTLTSTIFKIIGALAACSFIVSGISFLFGGVATAISLFSKVGLINLGIIKSLRFALFAMRYQLVYSVWPALVSATTAVWSFTTALLANPVTWVVIGVIALAGAVYLAYKHFDKLKAGFMGVMAVGKMLANLFVGLGKTIVGVLTFNPAMVVSGMAQTKNAIQKIMAGGIKTTFKTAYEKSINEGHGVNLNRSNASITNAPLKSSSSKSNTTNYAFTLNMAPGSNGSPDAIKQAVAKMFKEHAENKARVAYY